MFKVIKQDSKRHGGKNNLKKFFTNPMFRFMLIYKINQHINRYNPATVVFRIWLKNIKVKYNIQIPTHTKIGEGFLLNHYGGIVINQNVIIGKNCNVS